MMWTINASGSLDDTLSSLANGRDVYAMNSWENGKYSLSHTTHWQPGIHTLGDFRQTEPLKALFFPTREFIGRWNDSVTRKPMPERIVFGVKNCDLSSLALFDHVFLHGVTPDPYYAEARENTILVSTDCSAHLDVWPGLRWQCLGLH